MSHIFKKTYTKPKFWDLKKITIWVILLLPFSLIYFIIINIFKFSKNNKKVSSKVICVGNIYIGGTGKTPLVKKIFEIVKSSGKNPAFIKKKYKFLYDEIEMLKKTGPTFVDKNRLSAIISSINDKHDVAILDDGFQDHTIFKDLSILCFNSKQLIGNGFIIPSGPLREPFDAIKKANCIIINGEKNLEFEKKIYNKIKPKKIPIYYSKYKIKNIEKLKNKEITAFAGIGNPSNFFDLLKENNLNIKKTYPFPDHHDYTQKDFEKIIEKNNSYFVTTEKDFFRLNDNEKKKFNFVDVVLEVENEIEFRKFILENL